VCIKHDASVDNAKVNNNNNNNNNKSFIFPQIRVTMTGIEFLRSGFTGYSVHEHASVISYRIILMF
jgi:hypothetical protein